MKKMISLLLLFAVSLTVFSQQNDPSPVLTKQDYLKKSKGQKTAAWILLGGGFLCTALGSVSFNPDGPMGGESSNNTVFLVTGLAAMGTSIPLFIASSKNKKRAASLGFRMEKTPSLQQQNFVHHSYPALTLNLSLQ